MGVETGYTYRDDPGSIVRTFYVDDASKSVDESGRKVISNQVFVNRYGIKTVFGGGGPYPGPEHQVFALILFTKDIISRDIATAFGPLITNIQAATSPLLKKGLIFQRTNAPKVKALIPSWRMCE